MRLAISVSSSRSRMRSKIADPLNSCELRMHPLACATGPRSRDSTQSTGKVAHRLADRSAVPGAMGDLFSTPIMLYSGAEMEHI
jgi:hypothetical protein